MLIESLSLKTTVKGARVWINNKTSSTCGFVSGACFDINYFSNRVELTLSNIGKRKVAKGGIVDIQNKSMSKSFHDTDRVHVEYTVGKIVLKGYYHNEKVKRREVSLKERIQRKIPLRIGELFSGLGKLGEMITKGMLAAGIPSSLVFANDSDRHAIDLLANYLDKGRCVSSKGSTIVHDDLFKMDKSLLPEMDLLIVSYPCVGFSLQQSKSRKKDTCHDVAGLLFVPLLESISRSNASIVIIENSDQMVGSETDRIITSIMGMSGYDYTQTNLQGTNFGDFERRKRMAKVFYSKGLAPIDLNKLTGNLTNQRSVYDLLEPISDDAKQWKPFDYLKVKNKESSHCHSFVSVNLSDKTLPAFGANYGKMQADSAFIPHPNNSNLHRIFTAAEHCNVRKITGETKQAIIDIEKGSHHLQRGRTNSNKAHHLLGNSISPSPWLYAGKFIGHWLNRQFTGIENSAQ